MRIGRKFLILLFGSLCFSGGWFAFVPKEVEISPFNQDDYCGSFSEVIYDPVPVRIRPFAFSRKIAILPLGARVNTCIVLGNWSGVIIKDENGCDVATKVSKQGTYVGPCIVGWVETKHLQLIAG